MQRAGKCSNAPLQAHAAGPNPASMVTLVAGMQVIATAGHMGHGKSALVQALTGMVPGRLSEEHPRGPPAGLGHAWLTLPSGDRLAFIDVPGHERFVAAMAAAVGQVPAVLFVVAADQGWQAQSAEHLAVVDALGISRGLLVVTRADLADPEPVLAQASQLVAASSLGHVEALAVSAVTGQGLPALAGALGRLAGRLPVPDAGAPVRIWLDGAFAVADSGTAMIGTLPAGTVRVGDELVITPSMRPVRVQGIQNLGEPVAGLAGPARALLGLRGVSHERLGPGMALVQPGRWTLTDVIDVRLAAADEGPGGAAPGGAAPGGAAPGGRGGAPRLPRTVTLLAGGARTVARTRLLSGRIARLSWREPIPLHVGDRVLLREEGVRGAVVLDVAPPPLSRRGAGTSAAADLESWPDRPLASDLLRRHGLLRASALLAMGISEHPEPVTGEWLADPGYWADLAGRLAEVVTAALGREPRAPGLTVEAARAAVGLPERRLVDALVRPPLRRRDGLILLTAPDTAGGPQQLSATAAAAVRVLLADLATAPFASPDADRLRRLGLDLQAIAAADRAGLLLRISDQIVLAPGADALAGRILARLPQPFTAAEARQAMRTTRRVAIPLLEFLDRAGVTQRLPDDRRRTVSPPTE
jgi:selenocysteine-specific elongation factor